MIIALLNNDQVIQTWNTSTGEVPVRVNLPDGTQVSPVTLGWSSGNYSVLEVIPFEVPEGKQAIGEPSYEIEDNKVLETYEVEDLPTYIPDRVTSRQFKLALLAAGLIDQVEAWVEQQTRAVQIAFEYSGTFVRTEPMMQAGFASLGFTEQQINDFFIMAEQI